MISPTVGRIVLYCPHADEASQIGVENRKDRCAAVITKVHTDTLVNLTVHRPNGKVVPKTSVRLLQGEELPEGKGEFCEWMPYQKGQASKNEELTAKLEARVTALEAAIARGNVPEVPTTTSESGNAGGPSGLPSGEGNQSDGDTPPTDGDEDEATPDAPADVNTEGRTEARATEDVSKD